MDGISLRLTIVPLKTFLLVAIYLAVKIYLLLFVALKTTVTSTYVKPTNVSKSERAVVHEMTSPHAILAAVVLTLALCVTVLTVFLIVRAKQR